MISNDIAIPNDHRTLGYSHNEVSAYASVGSNHPATNPFVFCGDVLEQLADYDTKICTSTILKKNASDIQRSAHTTR